MRVVRRMLIWAGISVVIQLFFLLLINNIFLTVKRDVIITPLNTEEELKGILEIKMPEGASDIKLSRNNDFAAYMLNASVYIVDTGEKRLSKVISPDKGRISCFRWIEDRNMIIYAVAKELNGSEASILLKTYDADTGTERSYPAISGLPHGAHADSIELSALTNIVYLKVDIEGLPSRVYKFDIVGSLTKIMDINPKSKIAETVYEDNVFFESTGGIYLRNGEAGYTKSLDTGDREVLLDIDSNDVLYAGRLDKNNKIADVIYGTVEKGMVSKWHEIHLHQGAKPEDLFISYDGNIYVRNEQKGEMLNAMSGNFIKYDGEIIDISGLRVVTLKNRILKIQITG